MHDRARFTALLAALLLPLPVCAVAGEPAPWQLHGPADEKCDQDGGLAIAQKEASDD